MNIQKYLIVMLLVLGINIDTHAETAKPITHAGTITVYIPVVNQGAHHSAQYNALTQIAPKKQITLDRVILSPEGKQLLANRITKNSRIRTSLFSVKENALPAQVSLGMNDMPVLDQGAHGTCSTFAVTGMLDAIYGHGDYISQLCYLELSQYLNQQDPDYPNAWEGTDPEIVLATLENSGIISNHYAKEQGCAGVHEYSLYGPDTGSPFSLEEYTANSEPLFSENTILSLTDKDADGNLIPSLDKVKQALLNNNRVIVATLLDVNRIGSSDTSRCGAYGILDKKYDFGFGFNKNSWIITPEIIEDAEKGKIDAGHAMIITGYDDNAVIIGPNNTKHQGVLTLRNSWSGQAGDHGDYYMSYEYFNALVIDVFTIN